MATATLLDLPLEMLRNRLTGLGQPRYRAAQIWHAVYRDLAGSYAAITTLPAALRAQLETSLPFGLGVPEETRKSADGRTRKTLLRLHDGQAVEFVTMRYGGRRTVCVSTQVGCAMGCRICATGRDGFTRDLTTGEIVGQVLHAASELQRSRLTVTHVVYMGMGEPFLNYDATVGSIRILNDRSGFGLGARSFTVSTVGIVPGILRFAAEGLQANLAVSLHAANDELRDRLVPINRTYPLGPLLDACRNYVARTNRRATFEVALIDGINDAPSHARELATLLRGLLCHVNVIPFNPVPGVAWSRSPRERIRGFADTLEKQGIPVTVRASRGAEIQAACGQLRADRADAAR